MKGTQRLAFSLCIIAIFFSGGCEVKTQPEESKQQAEDPATSLQEQIGWLHGNCLVINSSTIAPGTPLNIANFDDPPNVIRATVGEKATSAENCYPLMEDRQQVNLGGSVSFYQVETEDDRQIQLAIGLLNSVEITLDQSGKFVGDINGDGSLDYLTQCATSEGINFAVWSKAPYEGQPLWSGYYYMGYDMEPTCSQAEDE